MRKADGRGLDQLLADPGCRVDDRSLGEDQAALVLAGAERLRVAPAIGQEVAFGAERRVLFGIAGWNDWRLEWIGDGPAGWAVVAGFAGELASRIDRLLDFP